VNEILESRLLRIENAVRDIRDVMAETERVRTIAAPPRPVVEDVAQPEPEAVFVPARARKPIDLEQFLGGRFLLGAGGLAFLIGVGLFLKYAFDNNWVGPSGRVAMGFAGGIAFLLTSEFIWKTGQRYYSQAIAALGAAILYLSLWAAGSYFHLLPMTVTFIAMGAVTAAVMLISIRRNSQVLAYGALAGGFITPLLNQTASIDSTFIFTYLAVLGTALVWIGRTRFPRMEISAFIAIQLYYFIRAPFFPHGAWTHENTMALTFATIFLLQFSIAPVIRARRIGSLQPYEIGIVGLSAALYYIALHVQLYEFHRHVLTALTAALAGAYVALSRNGDLRTRSTFAAIALALVTVGVGITFDQKVMASIWVLESAALLYAGLMRKSTVASIFGLIAFGCAVLAFPYAMEGGALFANMRFVTLTAFALALAVISRATTLGLQQPDSRNFTYVLQVAANGCFITALAFELYQAYHGSPLALSLLMLAYAVALVSAGFIGKREFPRWEGLTLFIALLAKVFLIDLSSLDTVVRIVSFLAVGGVLLIVALVYQRNRSRTVEQ